MLIEDESGEIVNINEEMKKAKFAVRRIESYTSRLNNDDRRNTSILSFNNQQPAATSKAGNQPLNPPPGMLNKCLTLAGPNSPLESKLNSVLGNDIDFIKVDPQSINSVVLNGDIGGFSSRLFIASSVTRNRLDGITLRELTMMPRLKGITELLVLIFCPKMVLRCDEEKTRYTVLQAGLGCDPITKFPLFPTHDAIFPVNVEITDDDFAEINALRGAISGLLMTAPNEPCPDLTDDNKNELQKQIKMLISR